MTKSKFKTSAMVENMDEILTKVAGETFLRREVQYFEGQRQKDLFNAIYNNEYTISVGKDLAKKILECVSFGDKIFNVMMYRKGNKFYAYKSTKTQAIFIEYKLYVKAEEKNISFENGLEKYVEKNAKHYEGDDSDGWYVITEEDEKLYVNIVRDSIGLDEFAERIEEEEEDFS